MPDAFLDLNVDICSWISFVAIGFPKMSSFGEFA